MVVFWLFFGTGVEFKREAVDADWVVPWRRALDEVEFWPMSVWGGERILGFVGVRIVGFEGERTVLFEFVV